jgi:DNA-binding NtrC family response regulator/predicted ATPase
MPDPRPLSPEHPTDRLIGHAPAMHTLRTQIRQFAVFDAVGRASVPTVLLYGETGTGKGLVARVIHDSGPRARGPFIDVNCAAIPETMLEAELFGFEAGAFTDAKRAKAGLFEAASGGALFLDEIDAVPMVLQSKLLKILEEKRLRRLGAVADHAVDVKLIAATSADLNARVADGRFRLDLYHRLAVVVLELPPLRARGEDILELAHQFLAQYATGHWVSPKRLSPEAEAWLVRQTWPGNVRELSHLMERMTLLHPEGVIDAAALGRFCLPRPPDESFLALARPTSTAAQIDEPTRIRQALIRTGGNVVRAAQLLGLRRDALRYRMRRHGIRPPTLADLGAAPGPQTPDAGGRDEALRAPADGRRGAAPTVSLEPPSGWEQKLVAVLAIDLTWPEVTALEAPPHEPWTVVARWEQGIVEKVQGFGGTVLQHTPSLLLVAFGVPQTLEQQPQRAVHAALALRQLAADEGPPTGKGPRPTLRLGLHWGPLLVATQPHEPQRVLVVGETLAVPVRLLGQAASGEVLASAAMGRLVERWCVLAPRAGAGDTGGSAPVHVITGARSELLQGTVRVPRRLRPFVGRAREMAVLTERWARAQAGRGQVVGLVGEPGVGKSRLLAEFIGTYPPAGTRLLETRTAAYTQMVPYHPLIDMLRHAYGLEDRDDGPAVREKIRRQLARLELPDEPLLGPLLALLEGPLEDPTWPALDPSQRRQRTREAIRQIVLRESQRQPVILVCEDLHWSDAETQAVLDRLVESLTRAPLLLLVTYRPEYQPTWGGRASVTQLRLDPLALPDTTTLLEDWLGADAALAPLKHRLIERTQGNPFFLEESLQTLIETGGLVGDPGAYRPATPVDHWPVPTTVQAVLAARLDRLAPGAKGLLQTAAVIGPEVPLWLLQAIAELPDPALHRGLAHLQTGEFLHETSLVPERVYTFKHALTHEVAYGSLLPERRRILHARMVHVLEGWSTNRLVESVDQLAHHALWGEVWDKAVAYGRQAGEKALARPAYREAVGYFEQALSALPHLPETRDTIKQAIDLRLALRTALYPSGNLGRILARLREAEALATALDDPRRLGQVSVFLSVHFLSIGVYDQAIAAAQCALALATAGGDVVLQALANERLGLAYQAQGDYRRAIDYFGQTVASLGGAQHHERFGQLVLPAVFSRALLAACHAELGQFAEGRVLGDEGLRIAEAAAHPTSLMYASWGRGLLALRQGDLPRALPWLERAVGLCQDADLPSHFPWIAEALGAAHTLSGRLADAVPLLTQAMAQTTATDMAGFQALCCLSLGEAHLPAGRLEEAHALAEQALTLAHAHQERSNQAYALRLLGDIAARREPPESDQAEAHYRQALVLAEELGMRPLVAHCHLGLGTLYAKLGRREEASLKLSVTIDFYRAMDMTFWLPQAEAALAEVEGR